MSQESCFTDVAMSTSESLAVWLLENPEWATTEQANQTNGETQDSLVSSSLQPEFQINFGYHETVQPSILPAGSSCEPQHSETSANLTPFIAPSAQQYYNQCYQQNIENPAWNPSMYQPAPSYPPGPQSQAPHLPQLQTSTEAVTAHMNQCFNYDNSRQLLVHQMQQGLLQRRADPRLHISTAAAPTRPPKKNSKKKRLRTAFTTDQVLALEAVFKQNNYINRSERQDLTKKLNISDRAIKVWFQNRRMKNKRGNQNEDYDSEQECVEILTPEPSTSADSTGTFNSNSSPVSDLDYIESQIHRPDEFGYVKLDSKAWGTLFNVIDAHVPRDINLAPDNTMPSTDCVDNSESMPTEQIKPETFYEPISPACEETTIKSESKDECVFIAATENDLKRLFDLHFC